MTETGTTISTVNAKELKDLYARRSSTKGRITKFKTYLNSISSINLSSLQINELQLRIDKIKKLSDDFDMLQSRIEVLNLENMSSELTERDNIEQDFCITLATALHIIQNNEKENTDNANNTSMSREERVVLEHSCYNHDRHEVNFKLPQIQVTKFDGTYFKWLDFRDTFLSLIHNNNRILPIHKFHYLVSYLEGDAARVVSNIEISEANYNDAWLILCERYDNKKQLISHHLNSLFNMETVARESERSLRFLVDHVTKNLRALATLGEPTDKWDTLVIHLVSSKLDNNTMAKWQEYRNVLDNVPTLKQFHKFLSDRSDVLQSLNRNKQEKTLPQLRPTMHVNRKNYSNEQPLKSYTSTSQIHYRCVICKGDHRIYNCPIFLNKNIIERKIEVSNLNLCPNCLRSGHSLRECRLGPCRECNKKHNTLLHITANKSKFTTVIDDESKYNNNNNDSLATFSKQNINQIILSTALIKVTNPNTNQSKTVRALLDCGSQSSFITQSLKLSLSLNSNPINTINIIGIGNNSCDKVTESCQVKFNSLYNKDFSIILSCLVLKNLTGEIPIQSINTHQFKLPKNIQLADPTFNQPASIDIIIGADIFWDIIGPEQRSLGPNNPILRSSKLGWLIGGPMSTKNIHASNHINHCLSNLSLNNVDSLLSKFWELESIPQRPILSYADKECEKHFIIHTYRLPTGRFCVRLPLANTPDVLGNSYTLAKRRFLNLEKRLNKRPIIKAQYKDFINEYERLGHLDKLSTSDIGTSYFLCHHAVFKANSESTNLRVVFDASARTSSGISVNDIQLKGPNIQDSLFSILIRARQYKYLLTGDIEKMYRQILLHEDDRNLQLILWREDESRPIETYRLNTVTYGFASASYLSTRCLWQLGEECDDNSIKTIIQHDFYVDDLITGANEEETLLYIQNSIAMALKKGCFNLRKYRSNSKAIYNSDVVNSNDNLSISNSLNTLGLGWNPNTDKLHVSIQIPTGNVLTKRLILSSSFKIFDPLGLLSPCIIKPKLLLQLLWINKLSWDEPVPDNISLEWQTFSNNLHCLKSLDIPRRTLCDTPSYIELHSFSDASQYAYGACIYMRSLDSLGNVTVNLLCAKSKVAPLKPMTIPRLELCAALLSARLVKTTIDSLRHQNMRLIHWCDSSVVLGWLKANVRSLKTFVANRIVEICDLTDANSWRYVPSAENPADLISRGVQPNEMSNISLWWSGPSFLLKPECEWPQFAKNSNLTLPEIKSHATTIKTTIDPIIDTERYSKLNKLKRIVAFVLRFIHNIRNPKNKIGNKLTIKELSRSFYFLCITAQKQLFSQEYDALTKNQPINSKSHILSLSPFIDKHGLIRVGGRIDASSLSYDRKHPILLHASHHLTKLIFNDYHLQHLHAGPQLLLASVRDQIWPINGRRLARSTVQKCVTCRRLRGKTLSPFMGNLPSQRITCNFPFRSVGVDFAGPFMTLNKGGRGARLVKCYLCIFICLRYKCIHLEAVSDLTKDAFIMTLRRFIARRGKPLEIFCDNGRNFVGAAKDIAKFLKLNSDPLLDFASNEEIQFKFSPSYAPHFGGVWEAGVKSAKYHIKRVMGNTHLTFEEISTLFAQVEAILNSRPLCPLSSNPNDFLPLSPGHFLIGRPITALPAPSLVEQNTTSLQRYARLEQIRQHFWQRWQREFISELQQRTKWRTKDGPVLKIGDLVLIQEDNLSPLCWRLGRVVRLFPGPDGVSRVADLNTTKGCLRRPLTRICPLLDENIIVERKSFNAGEDVAASA